MKVKDKRIIVTGGGSGIGRELVLQLLNKGAYVAAIDVNQATLEETKELAASDRLSIHVVDLANDSDLARFQEEYKKAHEVIDGIINNAGIIQPFIKVDKLEMDVVDRIMNVNFFGPLKLTKLFLPELLNRPEAHIVNVSSMGGFFPFPGQTVYGASKAALKILTEGMYAEYLNTPVRVTIVFPGAIATNISENSHVDAPAASGDSKMKALPAPDAANQIIDGMERDKFQVYVGSDAKMMNIMYKLNPKKAIGFINKMMAGMIK